MKIDLNELIVRLLEAIETDNKELNIKVGVQVLKTIQDYELTKRIGDSK